MYLRHLPTECRSILSADMATNTRPICQPRLSRVSVDMNRQACWPTPGRYFTTTRLQLGRHSAATRPPLGCHLATTWPILYRQSAVSSCYRRSSIFPALLREAFSGRCPFLPFNSGNIRVFFPAMFFPRHRFYIRTSLLSDAAAFGDCCFWRLVILGEQKMI